ncbi:glycosyltransferase family 2 protein [Neorhizobium galegae]|uniref:glycosyltransferase family 2 protein n=1 Tax=Neorhizobium galegae TaxID=399 RepID=UPI00210675EB|nr:glycosyltransferase family 2 protein [Neorhizobium galegae]MCQ1848420.1 glycosyltransferase family 2 protein [Neorhizobium galegae]
MKLSVVSTMYRSAQYLEAFISRCTAAAMSVTDHYEIVLVNDGSPDDSLHVALSMQERNPNIRIVDLSRNFGHHAAIVAGLESSTGDLVFLMDCDLEEQPEWLPRFHDELQRHHLDVVYGVQERRVSTTSANFLGEVFWKSINFMSSVRIPHNPMTCRLMTRDYVNALLTVEDRVLYLAGVFSWAGFKQKGVPLVKSPRPKGHGSTYSVGKRLLQVTESFSSFSIAPLFMVFMTGVVTWAASIIYAFYIIAIKLIWPDSVVGGFASLMLSIWFFSGLIILSIGIVGLYLAKVFQEVKRRPLFIVKKTYEGARNVT